MSSVYTKFDRNTHEAGQIKVGFVLGKFALVHTHTHINDCKPVNWMSNNKCECGCHVQQSVSHLKMVHRECVYATNLNPPDYWANERPSSGQRVQ